MSTHPQHWDDEMVARLPISAGRAELLEEIMSTSTTASISPTRPDPSEPPSRRGRWLVPVAAAAAAAALVAGPLWWSGRLADHDPRDTSAAGSPNATADLMVLDEPGWRIDYVSDSGSYGTSVRYTSGGASLEINGYPADNYDDYVQDRRHVTDPPSDGDPVEIAGETGTMWAYDAHDHTVIRPVEGNLWYEARGAGMDEQAFVALLGSLQLVDHDTFDAMLPTRFVTDSERPAAVQDILDGIRGVTDPVLPPGDDAEITSEQSDPYQLGADVAGQVACRWFAAYEQATRDGDDDAAQAAADTMSTSRDWPVLEDMAAEGDFSEVVWDLSARLTDGKEPAGYEQALGCTG